MKINSIQKVIKVGDSLAVTLPARDARAVGIKAGSEVQITAQKVQNGKQPAIVNDYNEFAAVYGKTLKNLANR